MRPNATRLLARKFFDPLEGVLKPDSSEPAKGMASGASPLPNTAPAPKDWTQAEKPKAPTPQKDRAAKPAAPPGREGSGSLNANPNQTPPDVPFLGVGEPFSYLSTASTRAHTITRSPDHHEDRRNIATH